MASQIPVWLEVLAHWDDPPLFPKKRLHEPQVEATYLGTKEPEMALSIKDPETERLARYLAELTGENITTATKRAIEERLRRLGGRSRKTALLEDMAEIRRRWSAMPVVDDRTPEEIIGYDEHGLPR
jgi:antitoxin VapB